MGKRGPYIVKGEVPSEKYPGYWLKPDGTYRKPCYRPNRGKEPKLYSRYFYEVTCDTCGKLHLKDYANMKTRKKKNRPSRALGYACSPECLVALRTSSEGHTRRKHGAVRNTHILERATNHPNARKGFVPQHRLVVEASLGRILEKHELVHHINCVKSDNRLENLDVFQNDREHFLAHGSLNLCVASLLENGHIKYNRDTQRYEVGKQ